MYQSVRTQSAMEASSPVHRTSSSNIGAVELAWPKYALLVQCCIKSLTVIQFLISIESNSYVLCIICDIVTGYKLNVLTKFNRFISSEKSDYIIICMYVCTNI